MPSSRPIVIHAGLPKTGTTYLQRRCVDNHAWLATHGIDYPALGREGTPGHHHLAQRCRGEPVAQPWAARPLTELVDALTAGPGERTLLASETFSSMRPNHAEALATALGRRELVYVLCIRRRSALCASRWQEDVKHGCGQSYLEYLAGQLLGQSGVLRLEDAISVAASAFGMAALRIVVYDELVARGVDLFDHFAAEVLGLPAAEAMPATAERVNPSLPPGAVEALRALNAAAAGPERFAPGGLAFVRAAQRYLAETDEGRDLARAVAEVFADRAEEWSLAKLDRQWRNVDLEILAVCRDQLLNAASENALFPDGPAPRIRALRPSALHDRVPAARFAAAASAVAASMADPAAAEARETERG